MKNIKVEDEKRGIRNPDLKTIQDGNLIYEPRFCFGLSEATIPTYLALGMASRRMQACAFPLACICWVKNTK